jgi:hypothetical protein
LSARMPQTAFAQSQGVSYISAGDAHACVIESGKGYCWGNNASGQLGDGSTASYSSVPVAVDTSGALDGTTLTQISANLAITCALDSSGAAYCWGPGGSGGLGDGSTANSDVPVAVDTTGVLAGKTLTQVSVGDAQACGLDTSAAAYCWGDNANGQLGDGTPDAYSDVPVRIDTAGVLAGKTLTQITAGWQHTCALDSAGRAYCWGMDTSSATGDLGDGDTINSAVPVAVDASGVLAGKTLTQVSADGYLTCAVDTAGAVYCWGDNLDGDLGDDGTALSDVPVLAGPGAPAGVTALGANATAAVSWTAPATLDGGTVTGYTAAASPGTQTCTTTGATACAITGLANGTTYSITVVAHTTVGDSGASTAIAVTPLARGLRAGPIISGYRKNTCVDDLGDSSRNDTPVVMWGCDGSPAQDWTIDTSGAIQINGKCLDIYRDEKTSKAPVELWTCTGGANQQWHAADGTLVNPVSDKCLDDPRFNTTNGTHLEIYTCNGGANQQWELPGAGQILAISKLKLMSPSAG